MLFFTKPFYPTQFYRFFLACLIIITLAYFFWTGSRYPALDEKALMSGAIQLEDPLGFEALFPLTNDMSLLQKIAYSTLNWIDTNKKGMSFGILFAAGFLTIMPHFKRRSFHGGFANAFMGMLIGTPLGVCVNCAAPIARGMYSSGMRAETTLAAMIASPTLNIVVMTMLFSLLPFYMAVGKIALSILTILVIVPLICRILPQTELPEAELICPIPSPALKHDEPERFTQSLQVVFKSYLSNLWYIIRMTVPLMLLAGALGATTATLLPPELITDLSFSVVVLIAVVLVGLFLPAPIAFDVVVTGAMLSAGLAHGYVMALLFTLGTFSIYSFFIVAQSIGKRAAWLISGAVAALGIIAGVSAQGYYDWQTKRALEMLLQTNAAPYSGLWAAQAASADPWYSDDPNISITATSLAPSSPIDAQPFTRMEADQIGITKPLEFSFKDMWPPFWEGRSLSSGDIDRDGDIDVAIASTEAGFYLYENDGTGQFSSIQIDLGDLADLPVFHTVLVDINNDGWFDLFVATYLNGNFILYSNNGDFSSSTPEPVKNRQDAVLALALTFGDADQDGDLDLAFGNWTAGWYRRIPSEESRNRILWNENGSLSGEKYSDLPGIPGETLSILFSDIDQNGTTDLLVANDFDIPDYFYYGDGAGGFNMIEHDDDLIPHTTTTTMAVKTADLDNSGSLDIYLAQIAGRSSGVSETLKMQPLDQYCGKIQNSDAKNTCLKNMEIKDWYKSGNNFDPTYARKCQELDPRNKAECQAMLVKDLAIQKDDPNVCNLIPKGQPIPKAYCTLHFKPSRQPTQAEIDVTHPQILRSNVLLEWAENQYEDHAEEAGLDVGGWSWDTKIADFDHDGFQDVYIVNGTWVPNEVSPSNLFFHNQGDGTFREASGPFGLEDYLMTATATAFDMDNDGDLDLLTHPVNGPLTVFRNNTQRQGIVLSLQDHAGNYDGIGAVLRLTDNTGRTQIREIQLGGGFMSFDAPRVHFGLGEATHAIELSIRWANGEVTLVKGPLATGSHYLIQRN